MLLDELMGNFLKSKLLLLPPHLMSNLDSHWFVDDKSSKTLANSHVQVAFSAVLSNIFSNYLQFDFGQLELASN